MTERKPPGLGFESWVDKQIREATERGDFDNLPGAGKPIADLDRPYDEVWVTNHLRREGLSSEDLLPTPLRLRKEVERFPETAAKLRTEVAVRDAAEELNTRIMAWLRAPFGPPIPVRPVKVEEAVERWRSDREAARRAEREAARTAANTQADQRGSTPRQRPWWSRLLRRPS
ncbi:DnaJ family domain-containing protein [Actinopolymorpha pittospori]